MDDYDKFVGPRIVALYDAAADIFDLKQHDWQHLRENMSPEQVKEFYQFLSKLWPTEMSPDQYLPQPSSDKLRAFYIGQQTPRTLPRKLARHSLYTDEILVSLPFLNPHILRDDFNPLYQPKKYMSHTLQALAILFQIGPWVKSGQVLPIPNPIDYNQELRRYVFDLADDHDFSNEETAAMLKDDPDLEEQFKEEFVAQYLRIPTEFEREWARDKFKPKTEKELDDLLKTLRSMS